MKKGRKGTLKRTEQSNESMRIFRQKENYKYFKNLRNGYHQAIGDKSESKSK